MFAIKSKLYRFITLDNKLFIHFIIKVTTKHNIHMFFIGMKPKLSFETQSYKLI